MIFPFDTSQWSRRFVLALVCVLCAPAISADAQRRRPGGVSSGFDDVVFAISFSPDGRTLAVARGASETFQRFGRIELWDTETGQLRHVIKGFDGPVRSVSFSPDGQTLVSGSSEFRSSKTKDQVRSRGGSVFGELKWWDPQTGELKHKLTLPGEGNSSIGATYSPDGKQLAIVESFSLWSLFFSSTLGSESSNRNFPGPPDRTSYPMMNYSADLKLVDAQTGEPQLKLNTSQPKRAVYSPDGTLLAFENGNEIKVWNTRTGREERKLKGFKGRPNAIAFSPDGQSLAVAATAFENRSAGSFIKTFGASEVRLFDVHGWNATLKLENLGAVNSLAFEPSGKVLLIGGLVDEKEGGLPAVRRYDLKTGKTATFPTGEHFSEAVDFLTVARRGSLLAFRAGRDTVRVLDTQTWTVKQTLDANSSGEDNQRSQRRFLLSMNRVTALAFLPDGKTLSGEIEGDGIKLWDTRTGEVKKRLADKIGAAMTAISPNGAALAEVVDEATVRLWTIADEHTRVIPQPGGESISALALSTLGQLMASAGGKELILWNARTGERMRTLSGHQATISRLVFSSDDRTLASADENGTIKLWDLTTGEIRDSFSTGSKVTALRFAPTGQMLASASEDKTISLWDLRSDGLRVKLKKHAAAVNVLAFSPDGQLLASGSDDRTVIIWEIPSGKSKRTLKGHDLTVVSLAFSPDGSLVASGGGNASVFLWEVRTGKLNRVLR